MRPLSTVTLLIALSASTFAAAPAAADSPQRLEDSEPLLGRESEEFFHGLQGLDLLEPPAAELWPLLERCQRELANGSAAGVGEVPGPDVERARATWMREYRCASLATELARRGTGADREALWRVFDDPEANVELRAGIVRGMLEARLDEAAADPARVATATPLGAADPLLAPVPTRHADYARYFEGQSEPAWLEDGSPDLREAWRLASSAGRAYLRATLALAGEEPSSFVADEAGFFQALADYLRNRVAAAEALRRIGRFEWGSWCGTGANVFDEPRDQAMLLVLLDLGRTELAAGALLAVAHGEETSPRPPDTEISRPGARWHRLAERLGLDWELLAIGSLLDGNRAGAGTVAVHGSERGARLLLRALEEEAPHGEEDERLGDNESALALIAALVAPGGGCNGFATSSLDLVRVVGDLPSDVQLQALDALSTRAGDASSLELASEAARQLHRLCRAESVPAFEAMSRSRFAVVREHGAKALHVLAGAELETVTSSPVAFRVRVDGAPWRGALEATVLRAGRMTSETGQADAQGRLSLDRDLFVDPKAAVRSVRVEIPRLEGPQDTWFVAQVPAPRDLSALTELAVETQRVTVVLPAKHAGRCASGGCQVRLEAETPLEMPSDPADEADSESEYRFFEPIAVDRPLRAGEPWTVRLVRAIPYRAVVEGGDGSWTSPVVVPEAEPVTLALRGDRLRSLEEEALSWVEASRP